ncbi:MAG: branched-chain amino acid ABC transporter permease [Alphaproteobacteria bacterium]
MLQQLVNGVTLGLMYALVALGYTLVFGVLRLLNFAHGEIFMLASILAYLQLTDLGWPIWLTLVATSLGMGFMGLLLWATCFKPASREEDHMAPALTSFAFGLIITAVVVKYWGVEPRALPPSFNTGGFELGSLKLNGSQVWIFLVSIGMMVGLIWFVRNTKAGRAMRAIAEHMRASALMGVRKDRVIALTFFVSSALAGAAGVLILLRQGVANPLVGLSIGIKAVAVMVIGGIGNFGGAVVVGIAIGIAEVVVVQFGQGALADAIVWTGLAAVLLWRPSGIFSGAKL